MTHQRETLLFEFEFLLKRLGEEMKQNFFHIFVKAKSNDVLTAYKSYNIFLCAVLITYVL